MFLNNYIQQEVHKGLHHTTEHQNLLLTSLTQVRIGIKPFTSLLPTSQNTQLHQ